MQSMKQRKRRSLGKYSIMKKIDLHIHTINTHKDNGFCFDLQILKNYVDSLKIDCIAITNHNVFSKDNFDSINNFLAECLVLPGIEVDLEKGHILVISKEDDVIDFEERCNKVSNIIPSEKEYISLDEFKEIFGDLSKYIIIPHYDKDPSIPDSVLHELGNEFYVGEVQSPKKFNYLKKGDKNIVPVLFSDFREYNSQFKIRQTYIKTDNLDFQSIKLCLKDKNKVFLNNYGEDEKFQILNDGTLASSGLNVIIGQRSSGKTHTLNAINDSFDGKIIKYIKQFSLVNDSSTEENFIKKLEKDCTDYSNNYLQELRKIVDNMQLVKIDDIRSNLGTFIESLIDYSKNFEKEDMYAKCVLFNSPDLVIPSNKEFKEYIDALLKVYEAEEYRNKISSLIDFSDFPKAIILLINDYRKLLLNNKIKEETNTVSNTIKNDLGKKSSINPITDVDFLSTFENLYKIKKFNELVLSLNTEKCLKTDYPFKGFIQQIYIKKIENATEMKATLRIKSASDLIGKSIKPYELLTKLLNKDNVSNSEIYKAFWKIFVKVTNSYGNDLSGGEKAEFNLLSELKDSFKYDLVLLDEPESSFDNMFLNTKVIQLIKEMSNKSTVFVVTHNNSLGVLLKPDMLICTQKTIGSSGIEYHVYYGELSSKMLHSAKGDISNYLNLIDNMEGGQDAYNERKEIYETIKN